MNSLRPGCLWLAIAVLAIPVVACQGLIQRQDGFQGHRIGEQQGWRLLVASGDRIGWLDSAGTLEILYAEPENAPNLYHLSMATFQPDGKRIAFSESLSWNEYALVTMDVDAREPETVFKARQIEGPQWAPNGSNIAFQGIVADGEYGIYFYKLGAETRGTVSFIQKDVKKGEHLFSWSSDSKRVVFQDTGDNIVILDVERKTTRRLDRGWFPTWSPDGRYIAYRLDEPGDPGYVLYDLSTGRKEIILKGEFAYRSLVWSPDSRYLAYSKLSQDPVDRSCDEIYGEVFVLGVENRRETKIYRHDSSIYPSQWVKRPR